MVKPSPAIAAGSVRSISSVVARSAGSSWSGGHPVELGEAEQPRHRDRPLAPLVGAEHRRLELLVGACLDVVERQALLPADRPQALADVPSVHVFHHRPQPRSQPPQCRSGGDHYH